MKTVIGLFLSLIITGSVFAQGISVNFDGAKVVYMDENDFLKKIDDQGNISSVLNTNVAVSYIHLSEQGNLFVVFNSRQQLSDGNYYLLVKTVATNNTISGIDTNLTSIVLDPLSGHGLSPGVQSDSSGNLYYLANQNDGKLALRKCVDANGTNIVNLINDNIQINNWLVLSDGTILMGGQTQSTSVQWLRKLTADNNLSTIVSTVYPYCLSQFPDNRVFAGFYPWDGYAGIYRLSADLSTIQASSPYIGNSNYFSCTPEYDVNILCQGHKSDYVYSFKNYPGAFVTQIIRTSANRVFAVEKASSRGTLVQYYPIPAVIEPTLLDNVTLIEKINQLLLIAGTTNGVNKLILYDPATSNETSLLNEDIEIYHLKSLYDGCVWMDGLKFNGNRYVVGKIQVATNAALHGTVKSVGQFQEMATLSGKPTDLVGVVASPILAPSYVTATDGTYFNLVRISWSASTDATSYQIWRYTNSYADFSSQLGTSTTTNYDDSTATPGTLYYYWVKATDGSNVSAFSISDTGYCGSTNTSLPVASDFDGDRLADPAVFNTNGTWKIKLSSGGYALIPLTGFLGGRGYTALAADFDGDGKADPAIYNAELELWAVKLSSINYMAPTVLAGFGGIGCQAIAGDFDGDRLADPALYNTNGTWKVKLSTAGYQTITSVGLLGFAGWTAIASDFDGDGKVDPAIYNASSGSWIVMMSKANYGIAVLEAGFLGSTGYTGMAADFDGDAKADPTVAQSSTGNWKIRLSGGNYSLLDLNGFLSGQ